MMTLIGVVIGWGLSLAVDNYRERRRNRRDLARTLDKLEKWRRR